MTRHLLLLLTALAAATPAFAAITMAPADGAQQVNPDTRLVLRFDQPPRLGTTGMIRIHDAASNRLVDTLDLAIPAGPTVRTTLPAPPYLATPYPYHDGPRATNVTTRAGTPSVPGAQTDTGYQLTIIGGFTDGFHFHPVIVRDRTATVQPHHNLLEYGKRYRVTIDDAVFGTPVPPWEFTTKARGPQADAARVVVSADGAADFNTVQGALDYLPDQAAERRTIFVRNGDYEEIVYFRNKTNLTIEGESRDGVRIHYANNEAFNPHPANISTNEQAGTFPSRRAAFAADNVRGVHLRHLTLQTTLEGQAEGLLITGSENIVADTTIIGSGDALQVNGSTYLPNVKVVGHGDTILGRGPAFFQDCQIDSLHAFMWIRNPATNHGNVFVNCRFNATGGGQAVLARLPVNKGKNYPHAEAVLIDATLTGIAPEGWGPINVDAAQVRFWEFNSRHADGTPVDVRRRHPASRQLTEARDGDTIRRYRDPAYVLGGWRHALEAPSAVTK